MMAPQASGIFRATDDELELATAWQKWLGGRVTWGRQPPRWLDRRRPEVLNSFEKRRIVVAYQRGAIGV